MNTNSNVYTVVYTAAVVALVAAVLAFVSQSLKAKQNANEKAETIGQILSAAQFDLSDVKGNAQTIKFYEENIEVVELVNENGNVDACLTDPCAVLSTSDLKKQNYAIAGKGGQVSIPVYNFKNGVSVVSIYGQGLWGPVWGYIAFTKGTTNIVGAYFDHASETPGLGGKIKDDPSFRAQFAGKVVDYSAEVPFAIVKGGAPEGMANGIDAITGATMTSKYLGIAINNWLEAYKGVLTTSAQEQTPECGENCEFVCNGDECRMIIKEE